MQKGDPLSPGTLLQWMATGPESRAASMQQFMAIDFIMVAAAE